MRYRPFGQRLENSVYHIGFKDIEATEQDKIWFLNHVAECYGRRRKLELKEAKRQVMESGFKKLLDDFPEVTMHDSMEYHLEYVWHMHLLLHGKEE